MSSVTFNMILSHLSLNGCICITFLVILDGWIDGVTFLNLPTLIICKGLFHAKMGSIKDRNGMDLTEAEDIKKRWQEYTEELYKKDLHNPDNHEGMITHTHLEPDILECEVR